MNDPILKDPNPQIPSYYNPHNVVQDTQVANPLLKIEPKEENPEDIMRKKYPIKIIGAVAILIITVLAIPVGVYLNQRPTRVFIEATATPSPTPSPTPTSTNE